MDLERFQKTVKEVERLRKSVERSEFECEQALKELKKSYKVSSLKDALILLASLKKQYEKAVEKYEEALTTFEKQWEAYKEEWGD